ncbi:TetR/AcrR family transcriptional regulator [Streptomyces sp. WMMC500]|uniref:TetR/AcrR family transcriptional regulator n=1 Tax=Streptomyces sp. WMMC500 TaxID=3015154 RepID=UPI00248B83ED|nr:TetR/AcrR family transcriptional regulator [Streptomyces sp. WMMC500]WBB61654.1 TetR/AcrR family transcriptional regulator [Streptomyces sp. WMMC500]
MSDESSAAEEAQRRALRLLWAGEPDRARGPVRGLTLDRIVAAAVELVEEQGLDALSMRALAGRLGIGTASLYTYLPGRAELEALMLDAWVAADVLPHERPGDWRQKLEATAREDWEELRRRPWLGRLGSTVQAPGPNMLRWLDSMLLVFDGTGLSESEKLAVVESVDAYVRGLGRLHLPEAAEAPAGLPAGERVRIRDESVAGLVDVGRYPALRRAVAAGAAPYQGDQFEFGLQRLLDGVAVLIASRE